MNKLKNIFIGALSLLMFTGCLDNYRDLNTDPELLGSTDPRNVFTGATENWNNSQRHHLMNKYSGVMQLMQYVVHYNGPQEGIYVNLAKETQPSPYTPYYDDYFGQIGLKLRYLVNTVIPNDPDSERYGNLSAIATILETYEAWLMFDVNGAAPYHEAFRLVTENIRTPKYDLYQKDIDGNALYKLFDDKVKESVNQLLSPAPNQYEIGNNDYFFRGDIDKWIKFGNTLRIKMAQRLEKADAAHYNAVVADALASGGGIISNNDESCVYNHPNEHNNNTDDTQILTYQYAASRALVSYLQEYNDPRLPLLVRRNGFGTGNNNTQNDGMEELLREYYPDYENDFPQWVGRYVGMSANPDSSGSKWTNSSYFTLPYVEDGVDKTMTIRHNSQIESRFYVKNGGNVGTQVTSRDKEDSKYSADQNTISLFTPLITYAETCFMMAEIALKSGSAKGGKDANAWFKEGIKASMEQYQAWAEKMKVPSAMDSNSDNYSPIEAADIAAYLAQADFQTATLEKIISQQWVNLFMRPEEAWATWKRTGLPAFKSQPIAENGVAYLEELKVGGNTVYIPRRNALPTPNSENIDNFNAAVDALKADANYGNSVNATHGRIWWDKP